MNNDQVIIKVEPSYGGTKKIYYTSKRVVNLFGGVDKVPMYCCGFYIKGDTNE